MGESTSGDSDPELDHVSPIGCRPFDLIVEFSLALRGASHP
jgi:hypothetical protein